MRFKLAYCLLFILTFGCTPKIQKLEIVRIGNIRLDSVTPEILTLRAELAVRNPYRTNARLKDISFDLAFTDHVIAYGKRTEPTELKGNSTMTLDVPLAVRCKQITEQDLAALLSEQIVYSLRGTAVLEQPFGPKSLPIDIRNKMKAPDNLKIFLQHKTASSILSLDRMETSRFLDLIRNRKLIVKFNNPFRFPVEIRNFEYQVQWAKRSIAEGEAPDVVTLAPGENRLELGIHPKPAGAIDGLFEGLRNRSIPDFSLTSEFQIARENRSLSVRMIYLP